MPVAGRKRRQVEGCSMSDTFRIAIAQSEIVGDVRANGQHIRDLMAQAKDQGARLIHFPEGALSGYAGAQIDTWDDVDWHMVQSELQRIAECAGNLGLWTIVGSNHQLSPPSWPHNSLFIISDEGELVDRYDKRICSNTETTKWYVRGQKAVTFDINGFRFGCALCIEIQFMEVFLEYAEKDVDCILFSAYSNDPQFWSLSQAYAALNTCWLSVSAPAQCAQNLASGLIGPTGKMLDRAQGTQLVISDLDRTDENFQIALTKAKPWRKKQRTSFVNSRELENHPEKKATS